MEVPKIDVQDRTLAQLLADMEAGKLQVPRFQREFVWPLTKTRALLDSMYKEFPIGTFFLWRAPAGTPPLSRPLEELGIPAPQPGFEVSYILDGQQRLASLYVVIKGLKVGRRDYGRICLDLQKTSEFEQNVEEGFEESIFVYHRGDNDRYVAVCDLVGPDHLGIYNGIREEWKPVFNKAYQILYTYPFSVVWVQEQQLGDAIEIFQRINQAGKRLSRYDLVCANVWTDAFDFRTRVDELNRRFAADGFGRLDETIYTQAFALILKNKCTTAAELSLQTDEILSVWDRVVRSLRLAVSFVASNLGVKRYDYLPYRGILAVLAYYFYHAPSSAISLREREALWDWFWRVTLSERYGSTSPSRMAEDAQKLRELVEGQEISFEFPFEVTSEAVGRTKMTSTRSALRNGVICMLALAQPKNLKDGSPVNLADDFFSDLKKPERHHIFPVGYLRNRGIPDSRVHLLPNFCLIPADLNREIASRAPTEYLSRYQRENPGFVAAAESHLLPVGHGAAVWNDDFQGFLAQRAQLIADELNRLVYHKPDEFVTAEVTAPISPVAASVDTLEVSLRNFIDHRLTAVVGPHYWKQTVPSDVTSSARTLISEHLSRHPYDDESDFASPRRRLDFCDVSQYEKIILSNWAQFEEFFLRKGEFQRHMAAYRVLRNAVQHNRDPSDVDLKAGEAAITWIQRILDQYSQAIAVEDDESSEEVAVDAMKDVPDTHAGP